MITLTPEQDEALDAISRWYTGQTENSGIRYPFRLFGPAGTGKTTLAREIAARLGLSNVVFGAYTGKAAAVLRRKGVPATTIHSAIYRPMENAQTRRNLDDARRDLAELHDANVMGGPGEPGAMWRADVERLTARIAELEAQLRRPAFNLNPMSEWAYADLIVLDEVSMVDSRLAQDIESFGVPVLVLGDPFQLPPISGGGYYTNAQPEILLTEIHRQALESPVLRLATVIRTDSSLNRALAGEGIEVASVSRAMQADQVLCWRNATRWKLTERIRDRYSRPRGLVVPGDRVICLTNNKDIGVLNGQQFDVLEVKDCWTLLLKDDDGMERWIEAYPDGFDGQAGEDRLKLKRAFGGEVGAFTYANVITVHKAQGSEWESVYVIDETPAMRDQTEARRWLYTAISRARESVTLARLRGQ